MLYNVWWPLLPCVHCFIWANVFLKNKKKIKSIPWTNARHVCTYLNSFLIMIQNNIKIQQCWHLLKYCTNLNFGIRVVNKRRFLMILSVTFVKSERNLLMWCDSNPSNVLDQLLTNHQNTNLLPMSGLHPFLHTWPWPVLPPSVQSSCRLLRFRQSADRHSEPYSNQNRHCIVVLSTVFIKQFC